MTGDDGCGVMVGGADCCDWGDCDGDDGLGDRGGDDAVEDRLLSFLSLSD